MPNWISTLENLSLGGLLRTKAHMSSLISDSVIHYLESIVFKLILGEISIF